MFINRKYKKVVPSRLLSSLRYQLKRRKMNSSLTQIIMRIHENVIFTFWSGSYFVSHYTMILMIRF